MAAAFSMIYECFKKQPSFSTRERSRGPADEIIEITETIGAECLANHSYIDMTRFFRRSDGKVPLKSAQLLMLFESLEARHSEESGD
jgi:hypothetical protein